MRWPMFRWRYIRCGKLIVLLFVCAVAIFSVMTVHNLSVSMRVSVDGFWQSDVDYFAKNIKIIYRVVQNTPPPPPDYLEMHSSDAILYEAELTLINMGSKVFPNFGWSIFFNQILSLEPGYIPRSSIAVRPKQGVQFRHFNGELYSISPTQSFTSIGPNEVKKIRFYSICCSVSFTDMFPNWYIVFRGLSPRVLDSTVGEPDQFVAEHNTSRSWKRNPDKNSEYFDLYNPPNSKDRFINDGVRDMSIAPIPVIPTPFKVEVYEPSSSLNVLTGKWFVVSDPIFHRASAVLIENWNIYRASNVPNSNYIQFIQQNVKIKSQEKSLVPNESYELSVDPSTKSITIKAAHPAGAFYAVQSLLSLTDQEGNVPETVIKDGPRFRYRGLMLDVARNFHRKETIMRYIDAMAMYKLNKLHLHLTDDEGWRIEIPDLPELTDVGSKRCHDLSETECILPFLGSGPLPVAPGSGFYTVDDYKDILRHAVANHVEVIPEIDIPGHSHAAIKSMQKRFMKLSKHDPTEATRYLLSDLQDKSQYNSVQNFHDGVINPCLESSYVFIDKIIATLQEYHRDISPLKTFHFGGDEVPRSVWIDSPLCMELNETGVKKSLKQIFAESVSDLAHHYSLSLAAWEDGLMNGETPFPRKNFAQKNIYVFAWSNLWALHQTRRAYTLANQGYKVVLTPATTLYLDHPYEPDPRERGLIWAARFTNTKKIFKFIPENIYITEEVQMNGQPISACVPNIGDSQCPELVLKDNIEGIQGSLFGELTRTSWILDFMAFPRLLALAERAWHTAPWEHELNEAKRITELEKDWIKFANTLGHKELARLDKKGFLYRIPPPGAMVKDNMIKVSLEHPGLEVQISMDGGNRWNTFPIEGIAFQEGKDIQLRTKAAFGDRYSKIIHLEPPTSNPV